MIIIVNYTKDLVFQSSPQSNQKFLIVDENELS